MGDEGAPNERADVPIRLAATVVLGRDSGAGLQVLMVRRNASLVFFGGAWVFPGGRVEPEDHVGAADALEAARIAGAREVHEEVGLRLSPAHMRHFSRWVTPPGRPRRFDARFFLVDAQAVANDPDDFSGAEAELSHLQWIPLAEARRFNLPFITEVVLGEVAGLIGSGLPPASVPFFDNRGERSAFQRLE